MATGFHKPDIDFLPDDLFPEGYEVCCTACIYTEHAKLRLGRSVQTCTSRTSLLKIGPSS